MVDEPASSYGRSRQVASGIVCEQDTSIALLSPSPSQSPLLSVAASAFETNRSSSKRQLVLADTRLAHPEAILILSCWRRHLVSYADKHHRLSPPWTTH